MIMRLLFVSVVLLTSSASPNAEEIRLADMTREDEVMLQRGYNFADMTCGFAIISEIEAYGGKEAMQDFMVDVGAEILTIRSSTMDLFHTCQDGVHTMHDGGEAIIIQRYDENGEPTMMEP